MTDTRPFFLLDRKMAQFLLNTRDPAIRKMIISDYNLNGERYIIKRYGVSRKTIYNWQHLIQSSGSLQPRYDLSAKKPSLTAAEIKKVEIALIADPFLTDAELAKVVNFKVTPRAIGNYIKKSHHQFVRKSEETDVEMSFHPDVVQENNDFIEATKSIAEDKRVYVDETGVSAGIRRREGRFPKGTKFVLPRNKRYPRMTIMGAIRKMGWVMKSRVLKKGSINTKDFESFVEKDLAPHLRKGDVVFWDRYGKSGRAKNPKGIHFSPKAKKAVEKKGAKFVMLPRYGKYHDPIELIWRDTKKLYEKSFEASLKGRMPSKVPFDEKCKLWHNAASSLSEKSFKGAFEERATGKEFTREYKRRKLL